MNNNTNLIFFGFSNKIFQKTCDSFSYILSELIIYIFKIINYIILNIFFKDNKQRIISNNIIIGIGHEGIGHLIQALVILNILKKNIPDLNVVAFIINIKHKNTPQFESLKIQFPDAKIEYNINEYPKSTDTFLKVIKLIIMIMINEIYFTNYLIKKYKPKIFLNFFNLMGLQFQLHNHILTINIASQFDLNTDDILDVVNRFKTKCLMYAFSNNSTCIPFSIFPCSTSIPQIIPIQKNNKQIYINNENDNYDYLIYTTHHSDIEWDLIIKSKYKFLYFSNDYSFISENITIKKICNNIEYYLKNIKGIISSASRGLPVMSIIFNIPTYLYINKKQPEHILNNNIYSKYYSFIFTSNQTNIKLSDWLKISRQNIQINYENANKWIKYTEDSVIKLVQPYLDSYYKKDKIVDKLLFENNNGFFSKDILNHDQKIILQNEINQILINNNSSHLCKINHNNLSITKDKLFLNRLEYITGCPIRFFEESLYSCRLLISDNINYTNSAEYFDIDLKRINRGRQFKIIITIIIEKSSNNSICHDLICTHIEYKSYMVNILENNRILHKTEYTYGKKILLIMYFIELNHFIKIDKFKDYLASF